MPKLKHATAVVLDRDAAVARREARARQIQILLSFELSARRRDELHAELVSLHCQVEAITRTPSAPTRSMGHFLPDQTSEWLQDTLRRQGRIVREEVA
jgi:hypothetical protein